MPFDETAEKEPKDAGPKAQDAWMTPRYAMGLMPEMN
jgi:hypothetical protein